MSLSVRLAVLLAVLCLVPHVASPQGSQTEHAVIKPMPRSKLTGGPRFEKYGQMTVSQRDGSRSVTKTVSGAHWYLSYVIQDSTGKRDAKVSVAEILANYEAEAKRAGGAVHQKAGNRLTFSLPRREGGVTWAKLYASAGSYQLDIVDEEVLETTLTFGAEAMKAALDKEGRVAVYGILFDTDKATLKPGSGGVLDEVAKLLSTTGGLRVEVQGHTDSSGAASHNRELSERRALAVINVLTLYGIDSSRLVAKGYGPDKPVADNATEDGRAKNRRVELVKIGK